MSGAAGSPLVENSCCRINAAFPLPNGTPHLRGSGSLCCLLLLILIFLCAYSTVPQEATNQSKFFLPQNPVAAAYVLGRLSNQELIQAPRGEFVYTALLTRNGLDRKYRLEALAGLARIRHTDSLTELARAIAELDRKGDASTATLRDLAPLVLQFSRAELSNRTDLAQLASQAQLPVSRQIGWAARIAAGADAAAVWRDAQSNPASFEDLLLAIPLVPDSAAREPFYPHLKEVPNQPAASNLLAAAASAMVAVPGHDAETFRTLAALVQSGVQPPILIESLGHIPPTSWPKDGLKQLAENVLEYLKKVPPEQRAQPAFAAVLQFETELATKLPAEPGRSLTKTLRTLGPTLVTLHAIYEQMRFDQELFVAEAGKPIVITLQNDDAMPHNLAILTPGALKEIGQAAEKMGPEPDAEGRLYVPASPKVLYATKLVAPGQKGQLAFTAPANPGEYPFSCTFPGHWLRMSGTMVVVVDAEAYLAAHPQSSQPKLTEWKLADFSAELAQAGSSRNPAFGKDLFSKLACVQCHRLGLQGYPYGPDLTDVFQRYKFDRAEVLEQILEPSKRIDERYRNYTFDLNGGDSVVGMILKEDDQSVTIQTGPADSLVQVVKKSEIQRRRPQNSSPMPVGLLNSLSKSDIFDLLSYVESGGKVSPHEHSHAQASHEPGP